MKWTDDEPVFRFDHEDVGGKNPAKLRWNKDSFEAPITQEWIRQWKGKP